MYRAGRARQLTFLQTFLEAEMALSPMLAHWDERLDAPALLAPLASPFSARHRHPTIPLAPFVRVSVVRRLYGAGDEALIAEVRHNLQWRRFCPIPLHAAVPHPTTLAKGVHALNDVLAQLTQRRPLSRGLRSRQDATVVESDIHYPTDRRLLDEGVRARPGPSANCPPQGWTPPRAVRTERGAFTGGNTSRASVPTPPSRRHPASVPPSSPTTNIEALSMPSAADGPRWRGTPCIKRPMAAADGRPSAPSLPRRHSIRLRAVCSCC